MMQRVNVLFVIPQVERGGTENLVLSLIKGLDANLFKPYLVYFDFFGNFQFLTEFVETGAPIFHVPRKKRFDLLTMMKISTIVTEEHIDVVNAHHFVSFFYSYFACRVKHHIKLVFTSHSSWEIKHIGWNSKFVGRVLLRTIDKIVGVTDEVTKCSVDTFRVDPSQACTIVNGVDLDNFFPTAGRAKVRQEIGADENVRIIGVVANFRKIKNHIFLLKAFAKLARLHKNIKLVLIGQDVEGDPESSMEEVSCLIRNTGLQDKVLFLGYRTDIPELLSGFDIFCLTSLKEGLPISAIEAMAAGLPVVGTNVDGIKEVVIPGRTGFLVNQGDIDGLVTALDFLIRDDDLRARMGLESRNLAVTNFSLRRCINEYQKLFLPLVQDKPPGKAKNVVRVV
ncbi:MAG: glycosyltransferase [Nitrososphaera sp.]|nr:glycosyltransferase [Nitrososphaera sp.]